MKFVRYWALRLVVALLAIQAGAFAVPAARESIGGAGGQECGCPCCRDGVCLCHRASATDDCPCSMRSVHRTELPWLLGITGATPVTVVALALAAPADPVRLAPIVAHSLRPAPPTPPPRA